MWILILTLMGSGKAIESIYFESEAACISSGEQWEKSIDSPLTSFICVKDGEQE